MQLCELDSKRKTLYSSECKLVAVKMLRPCSSDSTREEFRREVQVLAKINDPNIVRVLGASLEAEPIFVVVEYMISGDLNQYLQEHVAETATPLPINAKSLR